MYFLDSNLWIYLLGKQDSQKSLVINQLLISRPDVITSTQVVNEVSCILLKKLKFSESQIKQIVTEFYHDFDVKPITHNAILISSDLRTKYQFSFWDSLLVATAIEADCEIFYSEDLHHKLKVENMTILNPFLRPSE